MKFCDVCDNMLYIRLRPSEAEGQEPAVLQYVCKNCGNCIDGHDTDTKSCVLDTNYVDDQTTYKQYATPYIVHDPTLPRVNNIPCPNDKCTKPRGAVDEVIFVKFNTANLRFLYYCTHCGTFWKSGGGAAAAESGGNNAAAV